RVAASPRTELALDALEMAVWSRRGERLDGLVHHSHRGRQYLSIRYTERLAQAGAITSVGSRGDSYDNAMAESIIGLYKNELVHQPAPWKTAGDVEPATLSWVHWWNTIRLLEPIGHIPPVEAEQHWMTTHQANKTHYRGEDATLITSPASLHQSRGGSPRLSESAYRDLCRAPSRERERVRAGAC